MAGPSVGEYWGVQYYVDEEFHARLIVSVVEGKEVIITTPDLDVYEEDFDLTKNSDIVALVRMGPAGGKPRTGVGSRPDDVWRMFGPDFSRADRQRFMEEGAAYKVDLLRTRGVEVKVDAADVTSPALPVDPAGSWIIAEGGPLRGKQWAPTGNEVYIGSVGASGNARGVAIIMGVPTFIQWVSHVDLHVFAEACYKCGPTAVPAPGGATRLQARLAKAADGGLGAPAPELILEPGRDDRILPIVIDDSGERHLEFRSWCGLLREAEADQWPLDGPRTTRWLMKYCLKFGGGALARHTKWVHEHRVPQNDPAVYVHEVLSEFFEIAGTYDQLDVSNLACVERLARWYQDIEDQHQREETIGASDAYVSGVARAAGGVAYSPALRSHVTERLAKDAALMKERRKMKEERDLAKKAGKGGGKKDKDT